MKLASALALYCTPKCPRVLSTTAASLCLLAAASAEAQLFAIGGWSGIFTYNGSIQVDPGAGTAGGSLTVNGPAFVFGTSQTFTKFNPTPFPGTLYTDSIEVTYSAPAVQLEIDIPTQVPVYQSGFNYRVEGLPEQIPFTVNFAYVYRESGTIMSTGSGSYTVMAPLEVSLYLNTQQYPTQLGSSLALSLLLPTSNTPIIDTAGFRTQFVIAPQPVPEPETYALLAGLGLAGWAFVRRRR